MSKLHYRYSAMSAGKSTSLLQAAHNYEEQGQKVSLFTAAIDDRYGVGRITSRLGVSRDARVFSDDTDFVERLTPLLPLACVLVDECQFLTPTQVAQLHRIAHGWRLPVICFGLRSDFRGQPFAGAAALLTLADDLTELRSVCACGRKASMNMRVDTHGQRVTDGAQVEIGGNSRYRAVCPRCFYGFAPRAAAAPAAPPLTPALAV